MNKENPDELTQNSLFQTNTNAGSAAGHQPSLEQYEET
jgi:hypothetical protein